MKHNAQPSQEELKQRAEQIAKYWNVYYYPSGEVNNDVLLAMLEYGRTLQDKQEGQPTGEGYVIREFDSSKWYWCKCENCGWEDSSEYADGGEAIADTGDHFDPMCPVCFCTKIAGVPSLEVPEDYSGVHQVKIPIDLIIAPYKKTIEQLNKEVDNLRYPSPAEPLPAPTQPTNS